MVDRTVIATRWWTELVLILKIMDGPVFKTKSNNKGAAFDIFENTTGAAFGGALRLCPKVTSYANAEKLHGALPGQLVKEGGGNGPKLRRW